VIRVERLTEQGKGVAEVILDRPEKRNALTPEMLRDLAAAIDDLGSAADVRAIVVRGAGERFCAGFDLDLCRDDPSALGELLTALSAAIRAMRRVAKPVVVGAHGAAIAGGCALVGGGDVVVVDRGAKLGYPVVLLGVSPFVSAPTLVGAVGEREARRRMVDPAVFDGDEAKRIGLASVLVDLAEDVRPRAQLEAIKLAAMPPMAMAETKRWLNRVEGVDDDGPFDRALAGSMSLVGGAEERALLATMWERKGR